LPKSSKLFVAQAGLLAQVTKLTETPNADEAFGWDQETLQLLTDCNGYPVYTELINIKKDQGWEELDSEELGRAARIHPATLDEMTNVDRTMLTPFNGNQASAAQQAEGVVKIPIAQEIRQAPLQERLPSSITTKMTEKQKSILTVREEAAQRS
jgi:hypothetical protein